MGAKIAKVFFVSVCLFSAGAAGAVELSPYGFVLANAIEEWGRPNILDVPTMALSESKPDAKGVFNNIDVRQTRLGLRFDDADGWRGSTFTGVVEGDFFGNMATASSGNEVLQASPRIRLAYAQVVWGGNAVVVGQDWTMAFSPLNPVSLIHQAIPALSSSGNLWNRTPQIRWDYSRDLGQDGLALKTRAALVRSFSADESANTSLSPASQLDQPGSGEASGQPAYQASAEVSKKTAWGPWMLGVSGQFLQQKFPAGMLTGLPPAGATNDSVSSLLGGVHAALPLGRAADLSGEGFYGHGDQNLQGLGQVYANAAGTLETSIARGGWGQLTVRPWADWTAHLIYGLESLNQTGLAAGAVYRNETYMANAVWTWTEHVSLSAEYGRIRTYYVKSLSGLSQYAGLAAMYKFGKS